MFLLTPKEANVLVQAGLNFIKLSDNLISIALVKVWQQQTTTSYSLTIHILGYPPEQNNLFLHHMGHQEEISDYIYHCPPGIIVLWMGKILHAADHGDIPTNTVTSLKKFTCARISDIQVVNCLILLENKFNVSKG